MFKMMFNFFFTKWAENNVSLQLKTERRLVSADNVVVRDTIVIKQIGNFPPRNANFVAIY